MNNISDDKYWPNAGGTLGQNKVAIPDGVTTPWPEGDALVGNFVYKEGKLNGFIDTKALIANSSKTSVFPYEYVNISLPSIVEGEMTYNYDQCTYFILNGKVLKGDISGGVAGGDGDGGLEQIENKYKGCKTVDDVKAVDANYQTTDIVDGVWTESLADLEDGYQMFLWCSNLTTFNSDLSSLTNGEQMFSSCKNLTTFDSDLSSLTNGYLMLSSCDNLTTFNSDLSSLTDGDSMFNYCYKLESFSSDLSSLADGDSMFYNCNDLITFSSDLPNLKSGYQMFQYCYALTTFNSDLSSLTYGSQMFSQCENLESFASDLSSMTYGIFMFEDCFKLTSFSSDLSSLTDGYSMFSGCKLDAPSVKNIIDTINTVSSGNLTLGMGCNNTTADKDIFAQEIGYNTMTELLAALQGKGWTVTAQYNGRPTTTYSLRQPAIEGELLPVFVKLEEVEEHADYTSMDETKKYRLDYFHETTGSTDGYTQYATLEEAIEALSIKPIER